jgi:methionyl-tRNA formyltransferase
VPLRLVMMGTGDFALPTFCALYDSPHQVVGLFTQPDRTGRGNHHHENPLKALALENGTPVFQPAKVNQPDAITCLRELNADLCVVAAYGQLLSAELLATPRRGAINVHASLLPKYRGAAPIQYAVLNGERETGVTIFQIEPKLDAGPMLGMVKTAIDPKETAGHLETRLAELAVPLTLRVIDEIEAGAVTRTTQDAAQVTKAPRLKKEQGAIDWTRSAEQIGWHVRAMQPWPAPFAILQQSGRDPLRMLILDVEPAEVASDGAPGTILVADGRHLVVQTGLGALEVRMLRPDGKRAMSAAEFQNGHRLWPGDCFVPAQPS